MQRQKDEFDRQQKLKEMEKQRREKAADAKAKAAIKDQIAKDKAERASRQKGAAAAQPQPQPQPLPAAAAAPSALVAYDTARVQVRLTNGQALQNTFSATDTLAAVYQWVEANRTDGAAPFNLSTNFPKRVFSRADLLLTLTEAGLTPSGVLFVGRA